MPSFSLTGLSTNIFTSKIIVIESGASSKAVLNIIKTFFFKFNSFNFNR
jgi:hypothetical protein